MSPSLEKTILPKFASIGLLLFLVVFFGIAPFFGKGIFARQALELSLLGLLIWSVYICSEKRSHLLIAVALASPTLLRTIYPSIEVDEVTLFLNASFFTFVIFILLKRIFMTKSVTFDVIYAAISVYLLLGVLWGIIYILLEYFLAGSFNLPTLSPGQNLYPGYGQDLIYYSFITMTTVGYGDILPLSQPAKALAALEALMGQVYLTVLVARLVGMHLSQGKN